MVDVEFKAGDWGGRSRMTIKRKLPPRKQGRSGHEWQFLYGLWLLGIAVAGAFVLGCVLSGGCGEVARYLSQHGW